MRNSRKTDKLLPLREWQETQQVKFKERMRLRRWAIGIAVGIFPAAVASSAASSPSELNV